MYPMVGLCHGQHAAVRSCLAIQALRLPSWLHPHRNRLQATDWQARFDCHFPAQRRATPAPSIHRETGFSSSSFCSEAALQATALKQHALTHLDAKQPLWPASCGLFWQSLASTTLQPEHVHVWISRNACPCLNACKGCVDYEASRGHRGEGASGV